MGEQYDHHQRNADCIRNFQLQHSFNGRVRKCKCNGHHYCHRGTDSSSGDSDFNVFKFRGSKYYGRIKCYQPGKCTVDIEWNGNIC